jgi:hypothetical protein
LRDRILRQLVQGVPRERIEEELVRQGYALEYAIALVDSGRRTGRHDGVSYGTATGYGGTLVFFDEGRLNGATAPRPAPDETLCLVRFSLDCCTLSGTATAAGTFRISKTGV